MEFKKHGEIIKMHPTELDGKTVKYRLMNSSIRINKVERCREDFAYNWIVSFEGISTTYDIRELKDLEIIDAGSQRAEEIMEELKRVEPWSIEEKRLVDELFDEEDRMWRARMLADAKVPTNII